MYSGVVGGQLCTRSWGMVRCIVGCVCENERMYSWGGWGVDSCVLGVGAWSDVLLGVCVKTNGCIPGGGGGWTVVY